MSQDFPPDICSEIPCDTAPFVKISIEKAIHTLIEAMVLVFFVMLLFLREIRSP